MYKSVDEKTTVKVRFWVSQPPEITWPLLHDLPRIAPCLPGAEVLELMSDNGCEGAMHLTPGLSELSFRGDVLYVARDDDAMTACLHANAYEIDGAGLCQAIVSLHASTQGHGTRVTVKIKFTFIGPVKAHAGTIDQIQKNTQAYTNEFATRLEALFSRSGIADVMEDDVVIDTRLPEENTEHMVVKQSDEVERDDVVEFEPKPVRRVSSLLRWIGGDRADLQ